MNIPTADPIARTSDPATSWRAATSVNKKTINKVMKTILFLLSKADFTDEEMLDYKMLTGKFSPSGFRTRRNELLKAGLIQSSDIGKTKSGRFCQIWQLSERGTEVWEYIKKHEKRMTIGEVLYETGPF